MKHLQLIVIGLLLTTLLSAQRDRTLFDSRGRVGFFGAPIFEVSDITENGDFNSANGLGFGLVLGDLYIGGYGLGDLRYADLFDDSEVNLDYGHGGIWLGLTPFQKFAVHPYFSARLGWGAADVEILDDFERIEYDDTFFVISPEAGIELNVFRWFRVSATAGYQWYNGLDENLGSSADELGLNRFYGAITLRFGGFGRNRSNRW